MLKISLHSFSVQIQKKLKTVKTKYSIEVKEVRYRIHLFSNDLLCVIN